jgi:hypothetical protein
VSLASSVAKGLSKFSFLSFPRPPQTLKVTPPVSNTRATYHTHHTMTPTRNLRIRNLHSHLARALIPCLFPQCNRWFKTSSGLTYHRRSKHPAVVINIEDSDSPDSSSRSTEHGVYDSVRFFLFFFDLLLQQ